MVDFQSRDRRRTDETTTESTSTDETADVPDGDESPTEGRQSTGDEVTESTDDVGVAVVSISNVRSYDEDPAGEAVVEAVAAAGHEVVTREVLRTNHDSVQHTVDTLVKRDDVTAVVTTGATGVTQRDVTPEAVGPLLDRELPGFGELFRRRYADAVGTDTISTRATAGIADSTPVFCLPGDPEAALLAAEDVIVEQIGRLTGFLAGDEEFQHVLLGALPNRLAPPEDDRVVARVATATVRPVPVVESDRDQERVVPERAPAAVTVDLHRLGQDRLCTAEVFDVVPDHVHALRGG